MLRILYALVALFLASAAPALATEANSTVAEGSRVVCSADCRLYGFLATTGASAGYVLIFDATSAPSDGTVTPKLCYSVPATSTVAASWGDIPAQFTTGLTIVFSTTGCYTKTVSATAFFSVQVKP